MDIINIDKSNNHIDLLKKQDSENYYSYIWRIDNYIRQGYLKNWAEVVDRVNNELFKDEAENFKGESAYRKDCASARRFLESGVFDKHLGEEHIAKLRQEQDALYKIKKQLSDQRREYNKSLTQDGRFEHLEEKLLEAIGEINKEYPLLNPQIIPNTSKKEAILVLTDWHYGMTTDNVWNKYNTEICKERVKTVLEKTIEYLKIFNIDKLHIINCGDMIHGYIHISCRVASEENTVEQLIHVGELLAETIEELSKYVNHIDYYSCCGNHARSIPEKDQAMLSDNFERVLPWWIKQRLQNNTKIKVHESEYKEFTLLNVCGYNICCVHGDLDNIKDTAKTFNTLFNRKFGKTIDYIISGDKHHLEEFEAFDIESIIVRSLCGTDDYANNKRLYSSAGQTLIIMSEEEGRECTRNIKV